MTKEEFETLSKDEQDKILSNYNEYVKVLENSIWDHDPCEYELEWYLMDKCRGYDKEM